MCNTKEEQAKYEAAQRVRFAEPLVEEFAPYKAPLLRVEQQPGYIDIVYASDKKQGTQTRRFENSKASPDSDPRVYGLEEIVKVLKIDNTVLTCKKYYN